MTFFSSWLVNRCYQYCLVVYSGSHCFEVTEECALNSLCGTTTGENIFKEVEKTVIQYNMKQNLLKYVIYDGSKSVCSRKKYNLYKSINLQYLRKCKVFNAYGYSLYYSSVVLCGKYLTLSAVTGSVVLSMNFIHSCGLNHCQSVTFC